MTRRAVTLLALASCFAWTPGAQASDREPLRLTGITFTGFGLAHLLVGGVAFGVGAATEEQIHAEQCEAGECPLSAEPELASAAELQTVGLLSLIAGPASLLVGVPCWVAGELGADAARIELRPSLAGVTLIGRF